MNTYFPTKEELDRFASLEVDIRFAGEPDGFWSFVGSKSNQRWTWYAIERKSGCISAWHNGKRQDKDFLILWKMLEKFPISFFLLIVPVIQHAC